MNIGLAQVAPHGEVREAQHHGMFRHHAVIHHVLVDVATTEHLRQEGEQVRHSYFLLATCTYSSTGEMGHLVAGETGPVLSIGATVLTRREDVDP